MIRTVVRGTLRDRDQLPAYRSPAERLAAMWTLALDAWAFMGEAVREPRLPRHTVRVIRRNS